MKLLYGYCKCGCGNKTRVPYRNRRELGHIKGVPINYLKGHKMRGIVGKDHWNWKGHKAGYKALHLRVSKARGKAVVCVFCDSTSFVEWANMHGKYDDIYDYIPLCRKCHHAYDGVQAKGWSTRRGGDVSA